MPGDERGATSLSAADGQPALRRLVLIGAGRANLSLLHALTRPMVRGLELVLVTSDRDVLNPSMTAGLLRGAYSDDDARIDLAAVAERSGARVVHARADRLVPGARVVQAGAERIAFDLCVVDEIGPAAASDLPGVAEHAIALRPVSRLAVARRAVEARLAAGSGPVRCTVVGGGATGVECAFSLQYLLRARGKGGVVTIVDAAPDILERCAALRDVARKVFARDGGCFALGARVVEVSSDGVILASGASLPGDLVIWATGGAPSALIAASGLPRDGAGRLLVDDRLRASDGAPVWAAGDCAAMEPDAVDVDAQPTLLERELRSQLGASHARRAGRRADALQLLDTADGKAILRWGGRALHSRFAWHLRRRRDRRFVAWMREA